MRTLLTRVVVLVLLGLPSLTAVELPLPSEDIPKQLRERIVDSDGRVVSRDKLEAYNYFLFYVCADSCGACGPFNNDIIDVYNAMGRKKDKVAFVLIGRDLDRGSHANYLKENRFPFFTSYWQDLIPLRTNYQAFWFWRGETPEFYLLKKDGSCVISQFDWQTQRMAAPKATLTAITNWITKLQ